MSVQPISLQQFFEEFIAEADMLIKVYDKNMNRFIFYGRWADIKTIGREYRGPRYKVLSIRPNLFLDYEELGLIVRIDLNR